jgi:hypothetical protein
MKTPCSQAGVTVTIAAIALAAFATGFARAGTEEGVGQPGAVTLADTTLFSLPGVYPSTIYTSAGRWTFLVTGIPAGTITTVMLRLDGGTTPPVSHEAVSETSSLWDFDYPRLGGSATADILVMTERDTLVRTLAVVDTLTPSHGQVPQGEIMVGLKPHVFTWAGVQDPGAPQFKGRSFAAVPCADRRLAELMSFYGVSQVIKLVPQLGDGDSLIGASRQVVLPSGVRSTYVLRFPPTHSVFSFIELLKLCDSVLDSSWLPMVVPR